MPRGISQRDLMQMQGNQQLIAMATQLAIASKQSQIERERTAAQVRLGERGFDIAETRAEAASLEAAESRKFQLKLHGKSMDLERQKLTVASESARDMLSLRQNQIDMNRQDHATSQKINIIKALTEMRMSGAEEQARREAGLDPTTASETDKIYRTHMSGVPSYTKTAALSAIRGNELGSIGATRYMQTAIDNIRVKLSEAGYGPRAIRATLARNLPETVRQTGITISSMPPIESGAIATIGRKMAAAVPYLGPWLKPTEFMETEQVTQELQAQILPILMSAERDEMSVQRGMKQVAGRGLQAVLVKELERLYPGGMPKGLVPSPMSQPRGR